MEMSSTSQNIFNHSHYTPKVVCKSSNTVRVSSLTFGEAVVRASEMTALATAESRQHAHIHLFEEGQKRDEFHPTLTS